VDEEVFTIKNIFSGLVDGFGINQAKLYRSLMEGEGKTVSQLAQETGVDPCIVFREIKKMTKNELVSFTGKKPRIYYIDQPLSLLDVQIKKQTKFLQKKHGELESLIQNERQTASEYLIRITQNKHMIQNHVTKEPITDRKELDSLRKTIEQIIQAIREENKYPVYGYR
tara:strand:+ start:272 stop:778 length:507 start_codon:yes stop_codon:yes gene_type:complete